MMKHLILLLLLGWIAIYEAGSIVPKYYIRRTGENEYKVYSADQILIPRYILKDGKLFEPGKPILPKFTIEDRRFDNQNKK